MNFKLWLENQVVTLSPYEAFYLPYSLETAFANIEQGSPTQSEGHPSVIPIEGGGYYIWDGYHRLAAQILQGKKIFSFQIEPIKLSSRTIDELARKDAAELLPLSQAVASYNANKKATVSSDF